MKYDDFLHRCELDEEYNQLYDIEEDSEYFNPEYVGKSWREVLKIQQSEWQLEKYLNNN